MILSTSPETTQTKSTAPSPFAAEVARAEALGRELASLPSPARHDVDYDTIAMHEWPDDEHIRRAFFRAALEVYHARSAAQDAEWEATPIDDDEVI